MYLKKDTHRILYLVTESPNQTVSAAYNKSNSVRLSTMSLVVHKTWTLPNMSLFLVPELVSSLSLQTFISGRLHFHDSKSMLSTPPIGDTILTRK